MRQAFGWRRSGSGDRRVVGSDRAGAGVADVGVRDRRVVGGRRAGFGVAGARGRRVVGGDRAGLGVAGVGAVDGRVVGGRSAGLGVAGVGDRRGDRVGLGVAGVGDRRGDRAGLGGAGGGGDRRGGRAGLGGAGGGGRHRTGRSGRSWGGWSRGGLGVLAVLVVVGSVLGVVPQVEVPPAVASHGAGGGVTLVSNLGQGEETPADFSGDSYAQGFTTGNFAGGYALSGVELRLEVTGTVSAADVAKVKVELWSNDSEDYPYEKLADLVVPSSLASGVVSF
ncbi:MAG: hypothetical protein KTU85_09470, partial [Acidimicrobiia bacterium]|nr:hypothetical protein [Acidimicrobiia bacterium]